MEDCPVVVKGHEMASRGEHTQMKSVSPVQTYMYIKVTLVGIIAATYKAHWQLFLPSVHLLSHSHSPLLLPSATESFFAFYASRSIAFLLSQPPVSFFYKPTSTLSIKQPSQDYNEIHNCPYFCCRPRYLSVLLASQEA
jgi:hypothetical protein